MSLEGKVYDYLNKAVESGRENGMQFVVFHKDKCIVNANVGFTDFSKKEKITEDHIFPIFSTTKGVCATLVHIMAERGLLDYNQKVSYYWPGFKANVTVGQILGMTAGLYREQSDLIASDFLDWNYMANRMCELTPLETPGVNFTYHTMTFGWLAGNLACLVTGKDFQTLVEDEIKKPLGLKNLYVGAPKEVAQRVVDIVDEPYINDGRFVVEQTRDISKGWCRGPFYDWMNTTLGRMSVAPAASGVSNALDIAKMYASFNGFKKPLISKNQLIKALEDNRFSTQWGYRGYGYQFQYMDSDKSLEKVRFGHNGYNGSFGFCDTKNELSFAFNKNYKSSKTINGEILNEFYKML